MTQENEITAPVAEAPQEKKGRFLTEGKIELVVAIMLGVTALFSAWASWIGSLHGGNQITNYTQSNHLSSQGNSEYVAAQQRLTLDMMTWGKVSDLYVDIKSGTCNLSDEAQEEKFQYIISTCSDTAFVNAVVWAMNETENAEDGQIVSPFTKEGFVESYFDDAVAQLEEANEVLEQGKQDNANGDAYNLVTVIYTVVLFLLGIVGIFKIMPNREIVLGISIAGFLVATIYMFTLPMPTGFSIASFF